VCWLFPGKVVRVDAPCLCCGDPVAVEVRNGELLLVEPAETVGYSHSPVGGDAATRPFR
jgi:hypothetical protein